jgi:hypothetical protein
MTERVCEHTAIKWTGLRFGACVPEVCESEGNSQMEIRTGRQRLDG